MKKIFLIFTLVSLFFSACTPNEPEKDKKEEYIGEYTLSLLIGHDEFYMYDDDSHRLLATTKPPVNNYSNKVLKIWATDENDKTNGIINELFIVGGEIVSLGDINNGLLVIQNHRNDYYSQGIKFTSTYIHDPIKINNGIMEWNCTLRIHADYNSNSATGEYIYKYRAVKK